MPSNSVFQVVNERGWRAGLANLMRKELRDWWGTRTWLVQSIIWLLILNGILATVLFAVPASPQANAPGAEPILEAKDITGLMVFFILAGIALAIGTVIIAQDEIIDEKRMGTAAWILSKPVSRSAFILSKLIANAFNILVIMVLVQGVIAYIQASIARGSALPAGPFIAALGALFLSLMFYLTLVLMLGTLFANRGAVIGIPLAILFGYQLVLGILPWLGQIMPWALTTPISQSISSAITLALVTGQPLPPLTPVFATLAWCVVFIGVALWRFSRDEF